MTHMIRVRFAPSPTGALHIGGARTALYNQLFAQSKGGVLVLRIEDTDKKRSQADLTRGILEGLRWLNINWDEGPYFQSSNSVRYIEVAKSLVSKGFAYYCFCSESTPRRSKTEVFEKHHKCPDLDPGKASDRIDAEPAVIRFRSMKGMSVLFKDIVYGQVSVKSEFVEDFALVRSDGTPTYHLSVVVDDIDMNISHVIRGVDHLSNTTKQILLYKALGKPIPYFAHLPLIVGSDNTRLSKRHGATSVMEYRKQGFLPLALRNYLLRLGWSPKNEKEFFTDRELNSVFCLQNINRANGLFDLKKLEWFNAKIMGSTPLVDLEPLVKDALQLQGLLGDNTLNLTPKKFSRRVELLKVRARKLTDFGTKGRAFFSNRFEYNSLAFQKYLDPSDPDWERLKLGLKNLVDSYADLKCFNLENTESVLRKISQGHKLNTGKFIGAVRVALTGEATAPGIFDVIVTLGRNTVLARIKQLFSRLS